MRVLIADDHEAIRMVVKTLVGMYVSSVATVEAYSNGDDLLMALLPERGEVGLLVLDLSMPGYRRRLDLVRAVFDLRPKLPTLVYTASSSPMMMLKAVDLGVLGYVVKGSSYSTLQHAFEEVLLQQQYLDPAINLVDAARHPWWQLTAAERETFIALAKGESPQAIGDATGRSYKTVMTHKYNATRKLGLNNNAPLATYLADHGLQFELD